MSKTPKRPRDPNQLAKIVLDIATDRARARLGARKGGEARARKLKAAADQKKTDEK